MNFVTGCNETIAASANLGSIRLLMKDVGVLFVFRKRKIFSHLREHLVSLMMLVLAQILSSTASLKMNGNV